ncbi:MAG: matrixin family metalloprotease [Phycisphaerales bacterium]
MLQVSLAAVLAATGQLQSMLELAAARQEATGRALAACNLPTALAPLMVPRPIACFPEGSAPTPEMIAALDRAMGRFPFQDRYNIAGSWSHGLPTIVTWSLVPDGLLIPSAGISGETDSPSTLFATMDANFPSRELWIGLIQSCFDRWSQVCGIQFTRVESGSNDWDDGAEFFAPGSDSRGSIRIGMKPVGPSPLAYAYGPSNGNVVIDSNDILTFTNPANDYRRFRNVLQHELGHAIGLAHACPQNGTKLMEPTSTTAFDGVRHDEIRAVQVLYGDIFEPNDTSDMAADLGVLAPGAFAFGTPPAPAVTNGSTMGVSSDADIDYYKLTASGPTLLVANATPIGLTYASGLQNVDGSCSGGTSANSAMIQKLEFQLLRSDLSLLGTSTGTPTATLARTLIPAGTHLLKVYSTVPHGFVNSSQLYSLSGNAIRAYVSASTSAVRRIDVTWPSALTGASYQVFRAPVSAPGAEVSLGTTSATSLADTDVVPGVPYRYRIIAAQPGGTPVEYEPGEGASLIAPCPADFNGDARVDDADFLIFVQAYNILEIPGANPWCDLTGDLVVDDQDFVVFITGYENLVCPTR